MVNTPTRRDVFGFMGRGLVAAGLAASGLERLARAADPDGMGLKLQDPGTGQNVFYINPNGEFDLDLLVMPGLTLTENPGCPAPDNFCGDGATAYGVVDVGFDPLVIEYVGSVLNPNGNAPAAAYAQLMEQNLANGRVGISLNGDPLGPCATPKIMTPQSLWRSTWRLRDPATAFGQFHVRRMNPDGFPVSFADACGETFYEEQMSVLQDAVAIANAAFIHGDGFETGDTSRWSYSTLGAAIKNAPVDLYRP